MTVVQRKPVKIVVVGDGSVGKTCMIWSYSRNQFPKLYSATVIDTYTAVVHVDGEAQGIEVWDTAGQEDYKKLRTLSYSKSYMWYNHVRDKCPRTPIILVGTKLDLRESGEVRRELAEKGQKPVEYAEGLQVAKSLGARYMECSAVNQVGLKDVFDESIRKGMQYEEELSQGFASKKGCCTIS